MYLPKTNDVFPTVEAFKQAAQAGARKAGFAFSVRSSNLKGKRGRQPKIELACTMSGYYRNCHNITEKIRKRIRLSKRQDCPVMIIVSLNNNSEWRVQFDDTKKHTHELLPTTQVHCFPQHRTLDIEQEQLANIMIRSGASVKSIADAIYQSGGIIHTKDIHNKRAHIRNALNEGENQNITMHLLKMLEERNYIVRHSLSTYGHLCNLFFTYIDATKHTSICPEVLIVDATYKTNLYKMPLISAVGVSNIGNTKILNTFQIALAWVTNEQESTYIWFFQTLKEIIYDAYSCIPEVLVSDRDQALRNAADMVFPKTKKILCIWHLIAQNLKTSCSKFFESNNDYNNLVSAVQKLAYGNNLDQVNSALEDIKEVVSRSRNPIFIQNYIKGWQKDASCWMNIYTKDYPHMGIHSTQRGEGNHHKLKSVIEVASGLEQVFDHIDRAFRQDNIHKNTARGLNIVGADPFIRGNNRFEQLLGNISRWAIDQIKKEDSKLQDIITASDAKLEANGNCQCSLRINFKLPCLHLIPIIGPIPLSLINSRWLLVQKIEKTQPNSILSIDNKIIKALYQLEEKYYELADEGSKATFLKKINELLYSQVTEIKAPERAIQKGRPTGIKRDLLKSEYLEKNIKKKEKELKKIKKFELIGANLNESENEISNITIISTLSKTEKSDIFQYAKEQLPKWIFEYIKNIQNVESDGNCGFRALAISLGRPEDDWIKIRQELHLELIENEEFYRKVFPAKNDFNELCIRISWNKGPCNIDKWMQMPETGIIATNKYQRPVILLSKSGNITFLPYTAKLNANPPIVILFLSNHFVSVNLKPNFPTPPIDKRWIKYLHKDAKLWENLFSKRLETYIQLSQKENSKVLNLENIDLTIEE